MANYVCMYVPLDQEPISGKSNRKHWPKLEAFHESLPQTAVLQQYSPVLSRKWGHQKIEQNIRNVHEVIFAYQNNNISLPFHNNAERKLQDPPNNFFFFWKMLSKKPTEYFFKFFFFYLKVQSFRLIMENNFIQMAAAAGLHNRSNF